MSCRIRSPRVSVCSPRMLWHTLPLLANETSLTFLPFSFQDKWSPDRGSQVQSLSCNHVMRRQATGKVLEQDQQLKPGGTCPFLNDREPWNFISVYSLVYVNLSWEINTFSSSHFFPQSSFTQIYVVGRKGCLILDLVEMGSCSSCCLGTL